MELHIANPDNTLADPRNTRPQNKVGRVFLNSEVRVSHACAGGFPSRVPVMSGVCVLVIWGGSAGAYQRERPHAAAREGVQSD